MKTVEASAKFVLENQHKRSLHDDILQLKLLMPWIGRESLDRLHLGTLQPWIEHRRREGKTTGTINHGLKIVRRIVNLAASEWVDEQSLTWLSSAPKIRLLPDLQKRQPYPLNWEEQERLLGELPEYLAQMALFAVNTGCRDQEVCSLRWDWEVAVPQLGTSVFIIPRTFVKNGDERLVVLNDFAKAAVDARRGTTPTHVFTCAASLPRNCRRPTGGADDAVILAAACLNQTSLASVESSSASMQKPVSLSRLRISTGVARWLIEGSRAHGTGYMTSPPSPCRMSYTANIRPGFSTRRAPA